MSTEDASASSEGARVAFGRRAPDLFGCLYDSTAVMGRVVAFDLDVWRAPSGGWRDLFAAAPWRMLDLPLWLLDDLGAPGERDALEADLLDAGALIAVAILLNETWAGAEGGDSPAAQVLSGAFVSRATWTLARIAGPADLSALASAAWESHAAALSAPARWGSAWPPGPAPILDDASLVAWGRRFAPLNVVTAAALCAAGHPARVPEVLPLLERAAGLLQIARSMGEVTRDLARGHWSEPVARLSCALGMVPDASSPPPAGAVRLAMLASRAFPDLAAAGLAQSQRLLADFEALGLPRAGAAVAGLEQVFRDLWRSCAPAAPPPAAEDAETTTFEVEGRPRIVVALEAARAYLDIDPLGRGAWEEYRHAFLGQSHLTGSVFPLASIAECRILAGDAAPEAVDGLLQRYAANRFHYFDQPTCLPFDADSFGLMARLTRYASNPEAARELLATPLAWVLHNLQPDGRVPVFMTSGVDAGDGRKYIRALGGRCATVQASLVLGLMDLEVVDAAAVARAAAWLLHAVAEDGAAAFVYYDLPFSLLLVMEVIERLRGGSGAERWGAGTAELIPAAEQRLVAMLQTRCDAGPRDALEASCLWLATRHGAARPLRRPAWITWLLQAQRTNGAWEACPFYLQPARGPYTEWYSSRLITTAFAYRALADFAGNDRG